MARGRIWLRAAIGVCAGLTACAIKIDHSLITDGGAHDRAVTDRPADLLESDADGQMPKDQTRRDGIRDLRPLERRLTDLLKCTPSAALWCTSDGKSLVRCSSTGAGTTTLSCGSSTCDPGLKRCTACDPAQPSTTCSGKYRVTCSSYGMPQNVYCSLGCQNGACCTDPDADGYSVCTGDCNEGAPNVHPNQTQYFTTTTGGTYDYDCDGQDEPQYSALVNCQPQPPGCTGEGWQGSVPACGTSGNWVTCKKQSSECVGEPPTTMTQACH
jgi:hypothetical protein